MNQDSSLHYSYLLAQQHTDYFICKDNPQMTNIFKQNLIRKKLKKRISSSDSNQFMFLAIRYSPKLKKIWKLMKKSANLCNKKSFKQKNVTHHRHYVVFHLNNYGKLSKMIMLKKSVWMITKSQPLKG